MNSLLSRSIQYAVLNSFSETATNALSFGTYCYDMLDRYDINSKTLSMARTTGYTCSIIARLVAKGVYDRKGIIPPEYIGQNSSCYNTIMKEMEKRDVIITETIDRSIAIQKK